MNVQMVKLALIDVTGWNSRVEKPGDEEKTAKLADEIKADGVKQPIGLYGPRKDGTYVLEFGWRRVAASKVAGLSEIPADVKEIKGDQEEWELRRMRSNFIENMQRENLSPYEEGRALAALRDKKVKLKDIVQDTGKSESWISRLVSIYIKVDPRILTEWKNGNPNATTNFLFDLSQLQKHEEQWTAWQAHVAAATDVTEEEDDSEPDGDDDDTEVGDTKKKKDKKYSVPRKRYLLIIKKLKAAKVDSIAIAAVKYTCGITSEIPGVIEEESEE